MCIRDRVNGSAASFNQQTNVDLNNKYVVLDISELSGDLLIGMFVALDYVWSRKMCIRDRSGNESVHASPDTEVSCANSFSEEVGNASGNVSDVPKMETPTYSDSGISGNIESEQQVTNMGESSAQSAESGDLGNYSTTGDFAIDGLRCV